MVLVTNSIFAIIELVPEPSRRRGIVGWMITIRIIFEGILAILTDTSLTVNLRHALGYSLIIFRITRRPIVPGAVVLDIRDYPQP